MELPARRLVAFAACAAFFCSAPWAAAQTAPDLRTSISFAVLGDSVAIDAGPTHIAGNLGGRKVTGTSPIMRVGDVFRDDAIVRQARADAAAAYDDLARGTCVPLLIGEHPIPPGVYCLASTLLPDTVVLDAAGKPDIPWIFRIDGALTTAATSHILVINGGRDANVYWRVAGAVAIGAESAFIGNVLAISSITVSRDATVSGRLLAHNGAVTLNRDEVSLCCGPITVSPERLLPGAVGSSYSQTITASGGAGSYTFARFSGALPDGVTLSRMGALSGKPTRAGSYRFTITATDALGCAGTRELSIDVGCGATTIALSMTADGARYLIDASGGVRPYKYEVTSGELPDALILERGTGVISGPLATTCSAKFTITATDANGCTGSREFTICLLRIAPETLPDGCVGAEYHATTLSACDAKAFVVDKTKLPPGLDLSEKGEWSGTPTMIGTFPFTVSTSDSLSCTTTRSYTIAIGAIVISPDALPNGKVGILYSQTISASGCGEPPYVFEELTQMLPPELPLLPSGSLKGTPLKPAHYEIAVKATANDGPSASRTYSFTICDDLHLEPAVLPDAEACSYYSTKLVANGGIALGPLPDWLHFDPKTGILFGTPITPGDYPLTIMISDGFASYGCPPTKFMRTLHVRCNVTLSPLAFPDAVVGLAYDEPLSASCGTPPYGFAVTAGALPPGLSLCASSVCGVPTLAGSYSFTITATDAAAPSCSGSRTYTIVVLLTPPWIPTLSGWSLFILTMMLASVGVLARWRT